MTIQTFPISSTGFTMAGDVAVDGPYTLSHDGTEYAVLPHQSLCIHLAKFANYMMQLEPDEVSILVEAAGDVGEMLLEKSKERAAAQEAAAVEAAEKVELERKEREAKAAQLKKQKQEVEAARQKSLKERLAKQTAAKTEPDKKKKKTKE